MVIQSRATALKYEAGTMSWLRCNSVKKSCVAACLSWVIRWWNSHCMIASSGLAVCVANGIVSACSVCVNWPVGVCICIRVKRPHGVMERCVMFVGCWMLALLSWCKMSLGSCQVVRRLLVGDSSPGAEG